MALVVSSASLIYGGVASVAAWISAGWAVTTFFFPPAVLASIAVAGLGPSIFRYTVRKIAYGPVASAATSQLPFGLQGVARMAVGTVAAVDSASSALLMVGTGVASPSPSGIVAGASYVLVSGVVTGSLVMIRLVPKGITKTVSVLKTLLEPEGARDQKIIIEPEEPSVQSLPSSSSHASASSTPTPSDDLPSALPSDQSDGHSTARLSSSSSTFGATAEQSDKVATTTATASTSVAGTIALDSDDDDWSDWVRVARDDGEYIYQEKYATVKDADAVVQLSLPALGRLLDDIELEVAEVELYDNSDSTLSHPHASSVAELRRQVDNATLTESADSFVVL